MKPSLIVMAGGLGKRYGGLKQTDSFGPSGETILDYALYDAWKVGFKKIVLVINAQIEQDIKLNHLPKYHHQGEIEYVIQSLEDIPPEYSVPAERIKPWGTGHAVLVCETLIKEPFAIINADDFYGRQSFQLIHDHLVKLDSKTLSACVVGYRLENTLSGHGYVSRGVCKIDSQGFLDEIIERPQIYRKNNEEIYYINEAEEHLPLSGKETVSLNLMGFTPLFFNTLKVDFMRFLDIQLNDYTAEFYLPKALDNLIRRGLKVPVLFTEDQWFGVTYQADGPQVINELKKMIEIGIYPSNLWG
ncbi:MAG: sugar phosphate nucleotidyltransferase [Bacteroidetes bacterium]|nr:sugar phosphate nucleotidyltransferase [Bacteroidota bacterium]